MKNKYYWEVGAKAVIFGKPGCQCTRIDQDGNTQTTSIYISSPDWLGEKMVAPQITFGKFCLWRGYGIQPVVTQ